MTIRVLHIFAPNFRQRFGGPIYNWQFYFSKWDNKDIEHFVLDTEAGQVLEAHSAFNFKLTSNQQTSSRWARLTWVLRLYKFIHQNRERFDILHFHLIWWGSLLMALWAKCYDIPTLYESVLLGSDTPKSMIKERFGKIKVWLLKQFSGILAIANEIEEAYLKYGFSTRQVHMQMNCFDTDLFHPPQDKTEKMHLRQQFNIPEQAKIFLYVGSLIYRKGLDLLISAFIEVANDQIECFLWLVGPQNKQENPSLDETYIQNLKLAIQKTGLELNVRFEGMIKDRKKLAEAYRAADLFVFPSRKEGLPNVVVEAMASGLTVVISDLPGLKNVIRDGDNGLIVPMEDVPALAAAIDKVIKNPVLRVKLSRQARVDVLEHHGFQAWQSEIAVFYKKLWNKNQG